MMAAVGERSLESSTNDSPPALHNDASFRVSERARVSEETRDRVYQENLDLCEEVAAVSMSTKSSAPRNRSIGYWDMWPEWLQRMPRSSSPVRAGRARN